MLTSQQFVEPQQRFTIRANEKTIGTGVITQMLPARTDNEKTKRYMKALLKAEMERLGFNPYGAHMEKRCKPDYSRQKKKHPMAQTFAKLREEMAKELEQEELEQAQQ